MKAAKTMKAGALQIRFGKAFGKEFDAVFGDAVHAAGVKTSKDKRWDAVYSAVHSVVFDHTSRKFTNREMTRLFGKVVDGKCVGGELLA